MDKRLSRVLTLFLLIIFTAVSIVYLFYVGYVGFRQTGLLTGENPILDTLLILILWTAPIFLNIALWLVWLKFNKTNPLSVLKWDVVGAFFLAGIIGGGVYYFNQKGAEWVSPIILNQSLRQTGLITLDETQTDIDQINFEDLQNILQSDEFRTMSLTLEQTEAGAMAFVGLATIANYGFTKFLFVLDDSSRGQGQLYINAFDFKAIVEVKQRECVLQSTSVEDSICSPIRNKLNSIRT